MYIKKEKMKLLIHWIRHIVSARPVCLCLAKQSVPYSSIRSVHIIPSYRKMIMEHPVWQLISGDEPELGVLGRDALREDGLLVHQQNLLLRRPPTPRQDDDCGHGLPHRYRVFRNSCSLTGTALPVKRYTVSQNNFLFKGIATVILARLQIKCAS